MYKKLLVSLVLLLLVAVSSVQVLDRISTTQLDRAFTRAVTVFAIARALNGVISVVQGTEVYATPAGVGVNFSVGEIVDPMNDMVERFSWIMLLSSVSLGVQEIMLHLGQTRAIEVLLATTVLPLLFMLWFRKLWHKKVFNLIFKVFVLLSLLRFLVPLIVLFNEGVYTYVLEDRYEKAKTSLELTQVQSEAIVQKMHQNDRLNEPSWLESLNLSQRVEDFRIKMELLWKTLQEKFELAIHNMLSLIAVFIVESVLLPLFSLWVFLKLFRKFLETDAARIIENKTTKNV